MGTLSRGAGSTPATPTDGEWVCDSCRSINLRGSDRCTDCHHGRSRSDEGAARSVGAASILLWDTACDPELQVDVLRALLSEERRRGASTCRTRSIRIIGLERLDPTGPVAGAASPGSRRERWTLDCCGLLVAYVVNLTPDSGGGTNVSVTFAPRASAPTVPKAFRDRGVQLGQLDRVDLAVAICDETLARFGRSTEPTVCMHVADALGNKGARLVRLGQPDQAVATYDEVVTRFEESPDPRLRVRVATALVDKAVAQVQLEQFDQAVLACDEVVARFGRSSEPELRVQVARAVVNMGAWLVALDRHEQAIAAYDEVVARFGEAAEPDLRAAAAMALGNKASALARLDRSDEEIAAYDEVVERFGESPEPDVRLAVAMALVGKAETLVRLDRCPEAVIECDQVIRRYDQALDSSLLGYVEKARAVRSACTGSPESQGPAPVA